MNSLIRVTRNKIHEKQYVSSCFVRFPIFNLSIPIFPIFFFFRFLPFALFGLSFASTYRIKSVNNRMFIFVHTSFVFVHVAVKEHFICMAKRIHTVKCTV